MGKGRRQERQRCLRAKQMSAQSPALLNWDNKAIFGLIWPLLIEQVLAVTMGAVDTFMVSSVGDFAVSGVNIVDNINNLLIIAFIAMSAGGAVVVSQYIGRRNYAKANLAARQLYYISGIISLFIMIIAVFLRRPLISLLYGNIEADVMDAAAIYLLITAFSFPMLAIHNSCAALFRSSGNSVITMRISIMINLMNVGGNAAFIYGLKMGTAGAALSTLICRTIAAVVLTFLLVHNRRNHISLAGLRKIIFVRPMIRSIFRVGIPSGIESSMFQVGRILTQRIFTFFGTVALSANAIAGVINSFSFMPGMAYGMALITVAGQCIGAGDYEGAKRYTAKIMKFAYLTIFIVNLGVYIFMKPLVGIFKLSPEAQELSCSFLRIHCFSMVIGWGMSFALPNALKAAGDAKYVMLVASISMWTVRVSAAYLLSFGLGIGPLGVWIAMGADFMVRGGLYLGRWISGRWKEKKVIEDG